jgi:adenosylhomocysteinase
MPVLAQVTARFADARPLAGVKVAACLHVTAETAALVRTLIAAGAEVALCSANPLATQDDVAAALVVNDGVQVRARHGESYADYERHIVETAAFGPEGGRTWVTIDDGADLLIAATRSRPPGEDGIHGLIGGTEETTTGLLRLRRLQAKQRLPCPVLAVNEARTERALNDRHGTGQSALDGIMRATNVLLAGQTVVVLGYGWAGQGIAERARGAGSVVTVCEVDPLRALEARMAGYEVMPALEAAARGDIFVTVTGSRKVLRGEHFAVMKDGALLANAGHFDVEIDLEELSAAAGGEARQVRPLVQEYKMADGRRLNLLARGRVVNLAAAEGHPASVMDVSFALQALSLEALVREPAAFAPGVHAVPDEIDREVGRLKLAALGVHIDVSTASQDDYRRTWS